MKHLCLIVALLLAPVAALAQSAPYIAFTTQATGTISVTNTAQSVLAKTGFGVTRQGCLIQNEGTNVMYVFFGTTPPSVGDGWFRIQPPQTSPVIQGGTISCAVGGGTVAGDQVWIAGTSGEKFSYSVQGQ